MPMNDTIALLFVTFLGTYLYSKYRCNQKSKEFINSFLDSQQSITAIYDKKGLKFINKAGLKFFGYDSLASLLASHADIANFFIEEEGCISKYTYGKNWVESIYNNKKSKNNTIKVKISFKYFHITVSTIKDNQEEFLVNFNDITSLEKFKNELKEDAIIDPLTKIYNRFKFNKIFKNIFSNAEKYNSIVTMILFDIDHFKKINDNYGHNSGDKVLLQLSRLVYNILKEEDIFTHLDKENIFARWGGEEFIIVLEMTSLVETQKLASRLRDEIDKYSFDDVGHITCSFGVTQYTRGDTESLFFERVDKALYEAKERGRNRVIVKEAT